MRRAGMPLGAIVIGTMSPDFEFFFHLRPRALLSHTAPGLLLFCLPMGTLVFACWELLVREPVHALFGLVPAPRPDRTAGWWAIAAAGVLLGAASHLLWDGLTHGGYWGARLWPWLRETAFTVGDTQVPWFNAFQHLSTLVGGLVVVGWCLARVLRHGDLAGLWRSRWRARAVSFIVACMVVAALANGSRGPFGADFWTAQRLLGRIAVGGLLGMGIGVLAVSLRFRGVRGDAARTTLGG